MYPLLSVLFDHTTACRKKQVGFTQLSITQTLCSYLFVMVLGKREKQLFIGCKGLIFSPEQPHGPAGAEIRNGNARKGWMHIGTGVDSSEGNAQSLFHHMMIYKVRTAGALRQLQSFALQLTG